MGWLRAFKTIVFESVLIVAVNIKCACFSSCLQRPLGFDKEEAPLVVDSVFLSLRMRRLSKLYMDA